MYVMHVRTLSWCIHRLLVSNACNSVVSGRSNSALFSRQVRTRHRHNSPCNPPHKTTGIPCPLDRYPYLYQDATITYFVGINGSPLEHTYNELESYWPRSGQDFGALFLLAVTLMAMHLDGVVIGYWLQRIWLAVSEWLLEVAMS
jgi:hypothetical protein